MFEEAPSEEVVVSPHILSDTYPSRLTYLTTRW